MRVALLALTLGVIAIVMCIVLFTIRASQQQTTTILNSSTTTIIATMETGTMAVGAAVWGGIDLTIPNPAHIVEDNMLQNMDTVANLYPAAVFRGSLALQSSNLILDENSDLLVAGLDSSLRNQIYVQWNLQRQICRLMNTTWSDDCDYTTMYASSNCTCVCINAADVFINNSCVINCHHGHSTMAGTKCVCAVPYTPTSNCAIIKCPIGTFLNPTTQECDKYPVVTNTPEHAPACVNRSRAIECLSRGNWVASTVVPGPTVACEPIFVNGVIMLRTCPGVNLSCCQGLETSWWTINCTRTPNDPYCSPLVQQHPLLLTTYDLWQDGIPHNIKITRHDDSVYSATMLLVLTHVSLRMACVDGIPPAVEQTVSAHFWFTLADDVPTTDSAFGAVYRIWDRNMRMCLLSRIPGADEQVMYGVCPRGFVALAVHELDSDEQACGLFIISDGVIQVWAADTVVVDWYKLALVDIGSVSPPASTQRPVPVDTDTSDVSVNTTMCRALDCTTVPVPETCDPCVRAHSLSFS